MAEIPAGEYTQHIHRSIDQLRSINERGVLGTLGALTTDLRAQLVHDYKPFTDRIIEYKHNNGIDARLSVNTGSDTGNNTTEHHTVDQQEQKQQYSSPSSPPTPISMSDAHMNDSKVRF